MRNDQIKDLLSNSNLQNPIIIRTRYGFTKFWDEKGINFLSWGKNWVDSQPSPIDLETAAQLIQKSKLGIQS
jgi:hypothetical protein